MHSRFPLWLGPLLALCALTLGFAALAWWAGGGREFATDASRLLVFARHPLVLWDSYENSGLGPSWGSFPPLLPTLFGALVYPWTLAFSDFWAIRLGVLTWTCLLLVGLWAVLAYLEKTPSRDVRSALWLFATIPSVWGAAGLIPEEEAYVSIFALGLFCVGRLGHWHLVGPLLLVAILAAKYFLLILLLPLAFASPRPWRNAVIWGGLVGIGLVAYIGYHQLRFDLMPILSYEAETLHGHLSVWSLLWELGVRPSDQAVAAVGVLGAGVMVAAWAVTARHIGIDLVFGMTVALYITLLTISRSWPGYVLWALPLALVCWARLPRSSIRVWVPVLMFAWSAGEWGSNLLRGVDRALSRGTGEGKGAVAARVEQLLGPDFPYYSAHVACVALVVGSGVALIVVLGRAGMRDAMRRGERPAPEISEQLGGAPTPAERPF